MLTEHHHHQVRSSFGGAWEVARPLRDTSWWHRWRQERACRRTVGHCWHPAGYVDWWCCECSADTDGMPDHNCRLCGDQPTPALEVTAAGG